MSIEKLFKLSLITTFFMNMAGAVMFIPQVRFLREFGGLPEAGSSFYSLLIALWIFFFGVLYLRLYFSKTRERFFVAVGALGKSSFAVLLAVLAFAGELPARAAFAGLPDLIIAAIFSRGYTKTAPSFNSKLFQEKIMLKTTVTTLIAILIFQFLCIAPAFGQNFSGEAETAKIKAALTKSGTGEKSKVKIKLRDGREIKGWIAELNTDDFVIADSKNDNRTTIFYSDAAKVTKSGFSLGAKIGIAALVVGAAAVIVIAVGVKNLDDNIFPN